jgi:hypothetical protein
MEVYIVNAGITRVLYSQQCNGKTSLNKPSVFDKQARFAFPHIFTYCLSLLLFRLHCHSPSGECPTYMSHKNPLHLYFLKNLYLFVNFEKRTKLFIKIYIYFLYISGNQGVLSSLCTVQFFMLQNQ